MGKCLSLKDIYHRMTSQQNLWSKIIMNIMLQGFWLVLQRSHISPTPAPASPGTWYFLTWKCCEVWCSTNSKIASFIPENFLLHCTISVLSWLSDRTFPGFAHVRANVKPCRISGHIVSEKIKFFRLGSLFLNRSKADMPERTSFCLPLTFVTETWLPFELPLVWLHGECRVLWTPMKLFYFKSWSCFPHLRQNNPWSEAG